MPSMFTKAIVITGIIFVPMIAINTLLVNNLHSEQLNWSTLVALTGGLLAFIFFCILVIKMSAGKK